MGSSYDDWTVHQLKWTLKERGLPVSGKKRVLIERLESSDGLESSALGSNYDDWTVKELKEALKERGLPVNGNKRVLFDRLEGSPKGKNFFEEWALDAEDADLVEQIREKYRAPSYKSRPKREKKPYPLKLSIAIIVLCFIGIFGAYFIEMGAEMERQGGYSGGNYAGICCTSFLLFLILGVNIRSENEEMDNREWLVYPPPPVAGFLVVIGGLGILLTSYLFFLDGNGISVMDTVACWSSLILLFVPVFLFMGTTEDQNEKDKRPREWSNACKFEEEGWFDEATRIWSNLGEEGEVERVAGMEAECLCVVLKRKIKDLTEQGVNCTQLEEQLAMIETTLEGSVAKKKEQWEDYWLCDGCSKEFKSKSETREHEKNCQQYIESKNLMERKEETLTVEDSTITPSPDIDLEEHTGESLKEIEEEHTLVKDNVVSQISADAGEDDKLDKLKELIEMKEKGLIDDDEFKQMMMEIMGTKSEK